jgi:hypothetical protein
MGHTVPSADVVSCWDTRDRGAAVAFSFQANGEERLRDQPTDIKEDHFDVK